MSNNTMDPMTWKSLIDHLMDLPDQILNEPVAILNDTWGAMPVHELITENTEEGIVPKGHIFLINQD